MVSSLLARGNYRFLSDQLGWQIYLLPMDYAEIHYITYIKGNNLHTVIQIIEKITALLIIYNKMSYWYSEDNAGLSWFLR